MTAPGKAVSFPLPRRLAEQALQIAQGDADAVIHEEGANNRGDQVEFFQHLLGGAPGDPWCADFVSACLVKAYARLTGQPEDRLHLPDYVSAVRGHYLPLSDSCAALWKAAEGRYLARSREFLPAPGDLILFDFQNAGEPHHVGLVKRTQPADSLFTTIEGNTWSGKAGDQADGDGVYVRRRILHSVFGFIHFG